MTQHEGLKSLFLDSPRILSVPPMTILLSLLLLLTADPPSNDDPAVGALLPKRLLERAKLALHTWGVSYQGIFEGFSDRLVGFSSTTTSQTTSRLLADRSPGAIPAYLPGSAHSYGVDQVDLAVFRPFTGPWYVLHFGGGSGNGSRGGTMSEYPSVP